jgi:hypothetical protein
MCIWGHISASCWWTQSSYTLHHLGRRDRRVNIGWPTDMNDHRFLSWSHLTLNRPLLEQILIRPDRALFTLPLCRKTPVSLTIRPRSSLNSNDDGQTPKFDIVIECSHPFILLKTFQAIAMRLSFIVSDTEEGESSGHVIGASMYWKICIYNLHRHEGRWRKVLHRWR